MKSLHANNKDTDQTVLPSTQAGQHICHSFSVKYICISIIQSNFNVRPSHMFSLRDSYMFFLVVMLKFKSQSYKLQKKILTFYLSYLFIKSILSMHFTLGAYFYLHFRQFYHGSILYGP